MNVAPASAQPTETAPKPGRPEILDDLAKTKVLGLLELGHSRRAAARLLGCAANTITRAAARDPEFFAKLADAESQADSEVLEAAYKRPATDDNRRWIDDLRRLAELIELRGGNIILEQFSQKEGKKR